MMTPVSRLLDPATILMDRRFQPRTADGLFNQAEVDRMAQAGRVRGFGSGWCPDLYDPIHVWTDPDSGSTYVLEGFHRLALAQQCGIRELGMIEHAGCTFEEARYVADRSNLKTRPMDPIEEAAIYRRDREAGFAWDEIARRYHRKAPGFYERRATLAYLIGSIQDDVRRKLLPIDYAEVIGEVARDGATSGLQQTLAQIATQTKARIEIFRRLARSVLARQKGEVPTATDTGLLFDLGAIMDKGSEAATKLLSEAADEAQVRDGWETLRRAGEAQIRRITKRERDVPVDLARLVAAIDAFRAEADRALGQILGERSESGAAGCGVVGTREARPILKWVGSKRKEAPILVPLIKARIAAGRTYYEPFLGGGSVFFAVAPEKAILGDLIDPIITMYQMVRDEPEIVAEAIQGLLKFGLTEEVFLRVRAWEPADPRAVAARVIYLNKTAFNGLWRTNRAGKINSPWGKYTDPKFPTISDLQRASDVLRGATLVCQDWSDTISTASCGDCIFVDPPYPGTFDSYAGNVTTSIVPELAKKLRRKYEEGVGVVATIPDTPDIRALFEGWCEAVPIPRNSPVSCDSTTRTAIDQVAWASKLEER